MAPYELDAKGVVAPCPTCGQKNRLAYGQLGDVVRCGKCKQELPAVAAPVEVPGESVFDQLLAASSVPVVVDFWAPWCGPCRVVAPQLQRLAAASAGRLLVAKVNTDELPEIGARYGVQSIPTLAVFTGGREAGRTVGARPAHEIEAFVRQSVAG